MAKSIKSVSKKERKPAQPFAVVNPYAAGIDIGDTIHAVAVPPDSCPDGTYYQEHIRLTDARIEEQLKACDAIANEGEVATPGRSGEVVRVIEKKRKNKNSPRFNVRSYLQRILGVDVLAIYGLRDGAGLQILSETGRDMSKWPTEKHFVSWLNLCPNNKRSGGRLISSRLMNKSAGTATEAFRAAANAVQRSDNRLGDYFRRMRAKGGNKYAIVATGRKIATIYYKMVRNQTEFQPQDMEGYREKRKQQKIRYLEGKLIQLKESQGG